LTYTYERYQTLSQTSNEYLYEYNIKTKHLELSQNCVELFGNINNLRKLTAEFKKALMNHETTIPIIELPIADGTKSLFKSVNSFLYDDKGRVYSIIGKLIDINEEETEKKKLIKKSQTDGLTGIYNATTARNLITERIKSAKPNAKDALIVIDCDKYKDINDLYGHLQGDKVLVNISKSLTKTFRETDIIGRIGGDEFCVYMRNIPSSDFVVSKCRKLQVLIGELNKGFKVVL
jgi:diguanylate cyclase (GGDEF)-like protein